MTSDYNEYSIQKLKDWIYNAIDQNEISAEEIYECFHSVVVDTHEYHKRNYEKSSKLMKYFDNSSKLDDGMRPWGHSDLEYLIANPTLTEDRISNFPGEQYTEEEMNAMCDAAEDKEKCREYNLREAEYYNKRAQLDAEMEAIKRAGGFEWTPDPVVSRNDPTRIKYEEPWIYESPDGGKTVTKRKPGSLEKHPVVKADGYSTSEDSKKWVLPVEQSYIDGTNDYYVNFPEDLLEAANLKEGDTVEWKDQDDGSYLLSKVEDSPQWILEYQETMFEGSPESLLVIPDEIKSILGSAGGNLQWVFNKNGTFTVTKIGE